MYLVDISVISDLLTARFVKWEKCKHEEECPVRLRLDVIHKAVIYAVEVSRDLCEV